MDQQQQQLFSQPIPPQPVAPPQPQPWPWLLAILERASREIVTEDADCDQYLGDEDRQRIAGLLAAELCESAEDFLINVAMVNGWPPWDEEDGDSDL